MPFTLTDLRIIHNVIDSVELGYNNEEATPAIVWLPLDSNDVTLDPAWATLTTQGVTVLHEKDMLQRLNVVVSNQVLQVALAKAMLVDPTTSGVTGVAQRVGFDGRFRSKFYACRMNYKGTNLSTGAEVNTRVLVHKMEPRQYFPFSGAPALAVPTNSTIFTAKPATTDLLAAAIVGLKNATQGDYFSFDVLS